MFVVDTNILVYAANADARESPRARQLLEEWTVGGLPWFLTWGVVYEFMRVVTHRNVFDPPLEILEAWQFIATLLATPSLRILAETQAHSRILAEVLQDLPSVSGNLVHDVHIATLMREHGLRRLYTRDHDFRRFQFLEVVDPF